MLVDLSIIKYYFICLDIFSQGQMESVSSWKRENPDNLDPVDGKMVRYFQIKVWLDDKCLNLLLVVKCVLSLQNINIGAEKSLSEKNSLTADKTNPWKDHWFETIADNTKGISVYLLDNLHKTCFWYLPVNDS